MRKRILAALLMLIPALCHAQTQTDRLMLNQNAAVEQTYAAGANISVGQLVKLQNGTTTIGGQVYANVIPTATTDTAGVLGVADGTVTTGALINIRLQGQGLTLVDSSGCVISNILVNSSTQAGVAACTASALRQPIGYALSALAGSGSITAAISLGGTGGGGGGGSAAGSTGTTQISNGSGGFVAGNTNDATSVPNSFYVAENLAILGPSPYIDIRSYNARNATINTTGTGSGSSLTVGVSTFANKDGITIATGGNAPSIATPTGLAVAPGFAAGMTTPDAVMVATATGSSTYNYIIFACDIYDGCTAPTGAVTTTTAASTLGKTPFTISTWSLTGSTLTIVTSAANGFTAGQEVHLTGTSNNALGGGWYPISSITNGTTFVINNVPQYAVNTTSGTGGTATAMAGNTLTWTASTGGTPGTLNMPWEYYVCAERPGDGAYHIIGRSLPSTFYAEGNGGNFSLEFVDFGSTITANPIIPWDISNSNCTSGSAQNEMFTTTVASGGGGTALGLTNSLPNPVTGALVRKDDAPAFISAATAAAAAGGSFYLPVVSGGFVINSPVNIPYSNSIWQVGGLTVNAPIIIKGSTNWLGQTGIQPTVAFGFNGAPVITCNAYPCIYVGDIANQGSGGTTFDNLTFSSAANGLDMLVDANWGMIWHRVNFQSGTGNTDNMGMGLVIRPGAADYTIRDVNFVGGPNQNIDQTWTPLFYADRAHAGCCSGAGGVGTIIMDNTMWNRRGFYAVDNGGDGLHFTATGRTYSQGGITPRFTAQNTNGNVSGQIEIDNMFHDTESQATYAWICNISCSGGFGVPFKLGFVNQISSDAGTIPMQITGGGNQGILNVVASFSPDGTNISGSFGNVPTGYGWFAIGGRLVPSQGLGLGSQFGAFMDISPNVPTPELSLENSTFLGNLTATLTANRAWTMPDATGTVCLTSTCGGNGTVTNPNGNFTVGEKMFAANNTVGIAGAPGVLNCQAYTGTTVDIPFNACVTAAITAGDWGVDMSAFSGNWNVAAELEAGDSAGDNLYIQLPAVFTWTSTGAITGGTSCLIHQYSGTYLAGASPLLKGQFKSGSGSGALKAVYCNNGAGYYKAKDFTIYNPSTPTASGVGFLITGAFDNSIWQSIDVADYADTLAAIEVTGSSCCSFKLVDMTANGNYTLTGNPLLISSNNTATVNGLEVRGGSFDHPASGVANISCVDTSTAHNSHIVFSGQLYEEGPNSGTTGNINSVNGCGSVTVQDNEIKAEVANSTATAWAISNTFNTAFTLGKLTQILNFVLPATAVADSFNGDTKLTDPAGNFLGYNSGETYFHGISVGSAVIGPYIVSSLPAASSLPASSVATVTDSSTPGNCTAGGGTFVSLCYDTGSAWISLSGGGVGTGTQNCITDWATNATLGSLCGAVTGQVVIAQNGALPIFASAGVGGNFNISSSTYTIQCDSATTTIDRLHNLIFTDAAGATVTVPDAGTPGCGSNFAFGVGIGPGAGSIVFNRTTASTFMILNGSTALATQTSFTMTPGQYASISSPDNINWLVFEKTGGGGSGTPCTITANSLQFDSSGSFGCTTPFTYATNTITGASAAILDMSAASGTAALKVPVAAGNTASAAGTIDFDSTNKNYHDYCNGADCIVANFLTSAIPANNVVPKTVVSSSNDTLGASSMTDNGTTVTSTDTGGYVAPVFTANGSTAGFADFPQGSTSAAVAPCNVANSICEQAPTAVTAYLLNKPGTIATGLITNNVASAIDTQGVSGDSGHSTVVSFAASQTVGATSLCSTAICPAGTYQVTAYVDVTTACGVSGTIIPWVGYTDDATAKGSTTTTFFGSGSGTGFAPSTGTLTVTSNTDYMQGTFILRSTGAAAISYGYTTSACGSGTLAGKLYLSVAPWQP